VTPALGDFAVGLAHADLPVFPLRPGSKRPRFKGGFHRATCDPEWVAAHWGRYPEDNIGVRPPLGMLVVDIDPRNGGDKAWAGLVEMFGPVPVTWTARTGSGGWHHWFVVAEPLRRVDPHPWPGVDFKEGNTGFVVAPPSVHPNGRCYEWVNPPLGDPALAPYWVRSVLHPPVPMPPPLPTVTGKGALSVQMLVARINNAPEGCRNTTLFGACMDAAKQGDLDVYAPALIAAAVFRGLSPSEAEATVRSARRRNR
jgi:hypothetical protein